MLGSHATQLNHALLTACVAAVLTSVLGAVVLLGWAFDIPALKGLLPDLATMKPNTALCFVFSGTALWLLSTSSEDTGRWRRRGVVALALAVGLVAVLTLAEYIFPPPLPVSSPSRRACSVPRALPRRCRSSARICRARGSLGACCSHSSSSSRCWDGSGCRVKRPTGTARNSGWP